MQRSISANLILVFLIGVHIDAHCNNSVPLGAGPAQALVKPGMTRFEVSEGADLSFTRLTRSQGLSHQRVTHILQDDQGFMWFGTQYGLNRYDGYQFKVFKHDPDNPRSLCGNRISALFKDRSGSIWAACDHALARYEPQNETFRHYRLDQEPTSPAKNIRHISQDVSGMLWLSTGAGLYQLNPASGEVHHFQHDANDPFSLSSDDTKSSGDDRAGRFWVATREGIDAFDPSTNRVTFHVPLREPLDYAFYEDQHGLFWIFYASSNGLAVLDRNTGQLTRYSFSSQDPPGSPLTGVSSVLEDKDGTLWIGTLSDGILKFDRQHNRFVRYRNDPADSDSLTENRITTLFADREGDIWVGLGATEPAFFSPKPPSFSKLPFDARRTENLGERLVNTVYVDGAGVVWTGTTGGLSRLDRDSGRYTHYDFPGQGVASDVVSIAEDRSGAMWVGTSGQGLYEFDRATGRSVAFRHDVSDPSSLGNDSVHALLVDYEGSLWAATADGLSNFDIATRTFSTYHETPDHRRFHQPVIAADKKGKLWVAGHTIGVLRFDLSSRRFDSFANVDIGALEGRVHDVLVDHLEDVWVATEDGLNKINPVTGKVVRFSEDDGLASNYVSCILEDLNGDIWLGTTDGMSRLVRKTGSIDNYSPADGIPGPDLTGWRACARGPDGEMFFGGFSGATSFRPENIESNSYTPPVVLTNLEVFGSRVLPGPNSPIKESIGFAKELSLSHEQNNFSLKFSALSYKSPSTNRYRYKLEGLDKNWQQVGSYQRLASYTTLPAGEYQFRLQGATSRGPWSEPGVVLAITIKPPWWERWWAKLAGASLALLVIIAAYFYRMRQIEQHFRLRIEERLRERSRIARELHDSLLQGMQGLILKVQAASTHVSADDPTRTILEQALEHADEVMAEGRDRIQDLRTIDDASGDLPDSLSAVGEELAKEYQVDFRLVVEGTWRELFSTVRDEAYRISREAMLNAFRHAQAKSIVVQIIYAIGGLRVRIGDDGIGIDPKATEPGSRPGHWGLKGMRERAEKVGAQLDISSGAEGGTTIELKISAAAAYKYRNSE